VTTTTVNTVTETPPYCYQAVSNAPQEVRSQYVLRGNVLSFAFPAGYRRDLPLVIDPYLVFSTYSGSFTDNWGFTATYDEAGNLYSGGIEFGNRFPVSTGAFQVNFSARSTWPCSSTTPKAARCSTPPTWAGAAWRCPTA
jgi:hypothetical protein